MLKRILLLAFAASAVFAASAQPGPEITSWLQNTTQTGTYYMAGSSTAIPDDILVNCQQVEYSADYVYVTATGIPAYPTGPFLDGNPSEAENQNKLLKFPRHPQPNTGPPTPTTLGAIGVFINGVDLFDYRDGVGWNSNTNALCGGPGNPPCPGGPNSTPWNRDAVLSEREGFDCSKAHPAMGDYHHHQNPSAFKLDLNVISTICDLYDADGLYAIDSTQHSPLIGFAYDGYPIYGSYGYLNDDGTGGIVRMKSGYQLRNITERTTAPDGTDVPDGPPVNATYPLGYFREDHEFIAHPGEDDYLDIHNGRFCVTPEYPPGTYAYFATVDANWNSAFPYAVGPTFYGVYANARVTSVDESTTVYEAPTGITENNLNAMQLSVFPNPAADMIVVQVGGLLKDDLHVEVYDTQGKRVDSSTLLKGSTIWHLDTQRLDDGTYFLHFTNGSNSVVKQVTLVRE
jgi:hypothetical protein